MYKRSIYLVGQNVGLVETVPDDARLMFAIWQDPLVQKNFNFLPTWGSPEEYQTWQENPARKKQRFFFYYFVSKK